MEEGREGGRGEVCAEQEIPAGFALISPRSKIKGVIAMWDPGALHVLFSRMLLVRWLAGSG